MANGAADEKDEVRRLQGCINDLIVVEAMSAIWSRQDPDQVVATLLDVLVRVLSLDFAYARLRESSNSAPLELARLAQGGLPPPLPQEIGRALEGWLTGNIVFAPVAVPNPLGNGEVTIVPLRLGLLDEIGVLVTGSRRTDFPTATEGLVLRAYVNQALVALQEARALSERREAEESLRRARDELEQRVTERTAQLTAVRDELAVELNAMTRLHELSSRLLAESELYPLLDEVLRATMELQAADFGMVHLHHPDLHQLELVAQRGFEQALLDDFKWAGEDSFSVCGHALRRRDRVIADDIHADPVFEPLRPFAAATGVRAALSTPLFGHNNQILGMISTHFRQPHRPSEHELRLSDLYAREAAELIERKQAEAALRKSEEEYRTLFDSMDEGFCTIEMVFDENNKPVDYRFLVVNPSFEKHTGIKNAPGRRMRDIAPQHEDSWFEIYGRIALTGESVRFENAAAQLHRWYDVYAFRIGEPRERKVAVLFKDITQRKQAEEALAEARFELARMMRVTAMGASSPPPSRTK